MDLTFFVFALSAVSFWIYLYIRSTYRFWTKLGVKQLQPIFPLGDTLPMIRPGKCAGVHFGDLYEQTKHERFIGIYNFVDPSLLVNDPQLVKSILVLDSAYFPHRGVHINEELDPLSGNLFALSGQKWRFMRDKLNPTLSIRKVKSFFPIMMEVEQKLQNFVEKAVETKGELEIRDAMACYTNDVIASVAFGSEADSINNPDDQFRQIGRRLLTLDIRNTGRLVAMGFFPKVMKIFRLKIVDSEIERFFINLVETNLEYREKNNVVRKDFFQLLVQLRNSGKLTETNDCLSQTFKDTAKQMTISEVAAQAFVFFGAGFETTSSTMAFCLFELARNPQIQRKVQAEIDATLSRHNGQLSYEALQEMTYLDNCFDETLRIYPIVPALTRRCVKDYKIPDSYVILPKGTLVTLPIIGIQRDPNFYPQPLKFIPERFTDLAYTETLKTAYYPFGDGPRICIGMKMGKTMGKLGLASLLSKFDFELSDKHDPKVDMKFHKWSASLSPEHGIHLKVKKRNVIQ